MRNLFLKSVLFTLVIASYVCLSDTSEVSANGQKSDPKQKHATPTQSTPIPEAKKHPEHEEHGKKKEMAKPHVPEVKKHPEHEEHGKKKETAKPHVPEVKKHPDPVAHGKKKEPEPQKLSNDQLVRAYSSLQSIKMTLELANHDYGGHRAKALRDVNEAEKRLKEALLTQGVKLGNKKDPDIQWHPEPQKLSNAQLGNAIISLQDTNTLLGKADHDYAGHRKQAMGDMNTAVKQLQDAMKYAK